MMRLMGRVDDTVMIIRGWREDLRMVATVVGAARQDYSVVIENYLLACGKRGGAPGGELARGYIGLVEVARGGGVRWEGGRQVRRGVPFRSEGGGGVVCGWRVGWSCGVGVLGAVGAPGILGDWPVGSLGGSLLKVVGPGDSEGGAVGS